MKDILLITPYCPFPPHKSGGIHALYNILKQNKDKKQNIDLIYYDEKDTLAEEEISKYVNIVKYIDLRKKGKLTRIKSLVKSIPYGIYQYDEKKLNISKKYDLVIFDQELSIGLVDRIKAKEKRLMAYDSMNLYFQRKSKVEEDSVISKSYNKLQSEYYKKIHKTKYDKFDFIYYVSNKDTEFENKLNSRLKGKLKTINLGVDYKKFNSNLYETSKNKNIIFTGIMSYGPNKDAAIYFAQNILPKINKIDNEINLILVGKNSEIELKSLENNNVMVKGFVEDIVKEISSARIYISPLRYGTGMKNKVLEAMSCSKAIVASEVSIEGIGELKDKENIFIPKTDEEWIKSVLRLINDDKLAMDFGSKCRKIIVNNYSWEKAFNELFK